MKQVEIVKRIGVLGCNDDVTILFDERPKAVWKKDEEKIVIPVSATEITVQGEIEKNGRVFRSNAYFVLNGKCPKLYMTISGTKMVLSVE
ncbi:MAG: hypothetical protein K6B65_01155 [Bacilli bacterium]|nr:hypothetical protein [Bacilli bacterium]